MVTFKNAQIRKIALIALVALSVVHCGKKEEVADEDSVTIGGAGEGGGGKGVSSNLEKVSDNMLPGSLSGASLRLEGENPCADTDGFFDCQPNLLKLYMELAQNVVASVAKTVDATSKITDKLEVGATGTVEVGGDEVDSIDYEVKAADQYSLRINSKAGALVQLEVDESDKDAKKYHAFFNAENSADGGAGVGEVTVVYSSVDDFSADVTMGGMECNPDDFRAPEKIKIVVAKAEDVWKGKAMLYMPRWRGDEGLACENEVTDDTEMFIYTDFLGNDNNATASLFIMASDVQSVDEFPDHAASEFCTVFGGMCSGGYAFGDPNLVATYQNAFCVNGDDTTWATECDDFAAADYSDADLWVMPGDFGDAELTFPSEL